MESFMDLKVVCQKIEANEKNALGPFIHCRGKTPGTNRLRKKSQSLKKKHLSISSGDS